MGYVIKNQGCLGKNIYIYEIKNEMQPLEKVLSVQNKVSPHVWPITNLCGQKHLSGILV